MGKPDFSFMKDIETASSRREKVIDEDIRLIEEALESEDEDKIRNTHIMIDGKYQSCINGWFLGLFACNQDFGFNYDILGKEDMVINLIIMKPKLIAFKERWNEKNQDCNPKNDFSVTVNNNIRIDISFDQVRQKIEEMPGLTQSENEEIQEIINEMEKISQENVSKKIKWEKVKPILVFALDKSVDVAIMLMSLAIQMNMC